MERAFEQWQWVLAGVVAVGVIISALAGFWPNGQWGISDWDYYFSYHTDLRRMVLEHGTFPQWNPYICGGTSGIGDPEFPLFAPTFLLELLLGVPLGFRVAIFSIVSFGALGVLLLSRRLGLSPPGSLVAALVFSLSSVNLLEIVEGHPNVFSAFYVPWIFWSWLSAYDAGPVAAIHPRRATRFFWILLCGLFLALTFFQGGIYMLMYVGIAFIFLILALPQRLVTLKATLVAGLWALGFSAIKLVPVLLWLRQFQDAAYASSTYLLTSLHKILLGRYLHGSENVIPNQGGGWHEYGAYIGVTALVLAGLSLTKLRDKRVWLLWLGAGVAIFIASSGPLLKPLFDQAPFLPRSNISRFMIMAILPLTLLSGFGLDRLYALRLPRFIIFPVIAVVVALVGFDVGSYALALSQQAFILEPVPHVAPPPPPIAYTNDEHTIRVDGVDFSRAYAGAIAGYGTMSYCTVLGPSPAVKVVEDKSYAGFATLNAPVGSATVESWSPNRFVIRATTGAPAELILNANYAPGWFVNNQPARENENRLAAHLTTGDQTLTFTYRAPGFRSGLLLTGLTLLTAFALLVRHYKMG